MGKSFMQADHKILENQVFVTVVYFVVVVNAVVIFVNVVVIVTNPSLRIIVSRAKLAIEKL